MNPPASLTCSYVTNSIASNGRSRSRNAGYPRKKPEGPSCQGSTGHRAGARGGKDLLQDVDCAVLQRAFFSALCIKHIIKNSKSGTELPQLLSFPVPPSSPSLIPSFLLSSPSFPVISHLSTPSQPVFAFTPVVES